MSLALDPAGTLHVADEVNHAVRKVAPAGLVSTLAGLAGSPGAMARFNNPGGMAVDATGTAYVADSGNHTIRRIR